MERIIFPLKSFVAYVEYIPENTQLDVVLRTGKKYAYNVPIRTFNKLKSVNNKGSYVAVNIFSNFQAHFVEYVPIATVELITMPSTKYYRQYLAK